MKPYEIIGTPLVLYFAPEGTVFPALGTEPPEPWVKVGTNGAANYDDTGVTVEHSQTIEVARPAGTTGAVKAWRTEENMMIGVTLWDLTLEQYAAALNDATVNTTAAGAGTLAPNRWDFRRASKSAPMHCWRAAPRLMGRSGRRSTKCRAAISRAIPIPSIARATRPASRCSSPRSRISKRQAKRNASGA